MHYFIYFNNYAILLKCTILDPCTSSLLCVLSQLGNCVHRPGKKNKQKGKLFARKFCDLHGQILASSCVVVVRSLLFMNKYIYIESYNSTKCVAYHDSKQVYHVFEPWLEPLSTNKGDQ